jgi:hypothetical protein
MHRVKALSTGTFRSSWRMRQTRALLISTGMPSLSRSAKKFVALVARPWPIFAYALLFATSPMIS